MSKNNPSMINLLFLLAISLPQVSAGFFDLFRRKKPLTVQPPSNQCSVVYENYKALGGHTRDADPNDPQSCCWVLDGNFRKGFAGVYCSTVGNETRVDWIDWSYPHSFGLGGELLPSLGTL
jgi:hypothetical protein